MTEEKNNLEKINEQIKELVIARIKVKMSPNLRLSVGKEGSFDKEEMIEHVQKGDEVGKRIIDVHVNFMKAQANGQLTTALVNIQ